MLKVSLEASLSKFKGVKLILTINNVGREVQTYATLFMAVSRLHLSLWRRICTYRDRFSVRA